MDINIVCTIDDAYTQHCAAMLSSLLENNSSESFNIFIITENSQSQNNEILMEFLRRRNVKSTFIEIIKDKIHRAPTTHHISLATYFRLFIPEVLPGDLEKVLFIDSDIIIRKSIVSLFNVDIKNFSHAAVIAAGMDDYPSKIGLSESSLYFNAGLMLINIKLWRDLKIFERGCDLIQQQPERLKWWDQDVLNILLHNHWLPIDLTWNAQPFVYSEDLIVSKYKNKYEKFNYLEAKNDPAIVHFVGGGSSKPWHYYCQHPYKDEYLKYLKITPWKNARLVGEPNPIAKLIFRLGLGSKIRNLIHIAK